MRSITMVMYFIGILLAPAPGIAEHNPLLPRPHPVRYGIGSLPLHGLLVGLSQKAAAEDRFAAEAVLTEVEIHDWPSLAYRGTMVDMHDGSLPSEEGIKRQPDFLARWKANQYYLYSEASIELEGYPPLNPQGRLSQDEVRRIVAYGRERNIDVIPNLELYAHLHDLFRVEEFSGLSDLPHGTEFDPHNPKVMVLLTDWVDQIARLFPSPFVHIGFEETFQIEMAAKEGASATPTMVYVKQLTDGTRLFQQRGKHVMAWADIMLRYLQKVFGSQTMFAIWKDPFFPVYSKNPAQHREDLRQARLLAEEAEKHLDHALALGGDAATLNSLLVGSRLLDYGGQKFQTPPELDDLWQRMGRRRPKGDEWWNEWESQVFYQDHPPIVDFMEAISELRALYRTEWLVEYTSYRLGSALGRWDTEYEYWRKLQQRLRRFSDSSREGDVLPPLETLAGER